MRSKKKTKQQRHRTKKASEAPSISSSDGEEDYISLSLETNDSNISSGSKRKRGDSSSDSELEVMNPSVCFPWMHQALCNLGRSTTINTMLENEISCFLQYLEPSRAERRLREYLIHKVRTVIEELCPKATVEVFGSFSTQLYLPNSDIDLVVTLPRSSGLSLRAIASRLVHEGVCRDPQVIEHAQVPVIKFEDRLTPFKVDVIVDSSSSTAGVDSAKIINAMAKKQPGLRALTLIVKHYLALRNLNEVFKGGLGGYAIVCLVMGFLQMHPKVASRAIDPEKNLGPLLLDFLQLYGINFNMADVGLKVSSAGSCFVEGGVRGRKGMPVYSILDPQNETNDIGYKSFESRRVMKTFRFAYLALTDRAFALSEKIEKRTGEGLKEKYRSNHRKASLLGTFLFVPNEMIQQRKHISNIYERRLWAGEKAASSFDWEEDEREVQEAKN